MSGPASRVRLDGVWAWALQPSRPARHRCQAPMQGTRRMRTRGRRAQPVQGRALGRGLEQREARRRELKARRAHGRLLGQALDGRARQQVCTAGEGQAGTAGGGQPWLQPVDAWRPREQAMGAASHAAGQEGAGQEEARLCPADAGPWTHQRRPLEAWHRRCHRLTRCHGGTDGWGSGRQVSACEAHSLHRLPAARGQQVRRSSSRLQSSTVRPPPAHHLRTWAAWQSQRWRCRAQGWPAGWCRQTCQSWWSTWCVAVTDQAGTPARRRRGMQ